MRLAYLTARFPEHASERFLEPEVRALAEYVDLTIVPVQSKGSFAGRDVRAAFNEFASRPVRSTGLLATLLFRSGGFRAALKSAGAFPRGLAMARKFRREGVEHVHAIGLGIPSTVAYVASRLSGIPYSIGVHEREIPISGLMSLKLAKAKFARTVSTRTCRGLQALVPSAAAQCHVVHAGVAVPEFQAEPPLRRVPRVLCAGDDPAEVLSALAQLRERGCVFACDLVSDQLPARIERLIELNHLRGLAALRRDLSFEGLREALSGGDYDIFILATGDARPEREDIPMTALLAMAAGTATLAFTGASLDEVIDAGSGFLIPPHDARALESALERLVLDSGLRRRTGQRARDRVMAGFDIDGTTQQLAQRIYGGSHWVRIPVAGALGEGR